MKGGLTAGLHDRRDRDGAVEARRNERSADGNERGQEVDDGLARLVPLAVDLGDADEDEDEVEDRLLHRAQLSDQVGEERPVARARAVTRALAWRWRGPGRV